MELPVADRHLTNDELNALCAKVAAGNRSEEHALLAAMSRRIYSCINKMLGTPRFRRLQEHRDDLVAAAAASVIQNGRNYRSSKNDRADLFLEQRFRWDVKIEARKFLSPVGAKPVCGSGNDLTDPCFQRYSPFMEPGNEESSEGDVAASVDARQQEVVRARHLVKNRLRRLSLEERAVIMALYGIHDKPSSRDAYAAARARNTHRMTVREIAEARGVRILQVMAIRDAALAKLASS